jgi:hypothetical protein
VKKLVPRESKGPPNLPRRQLLLLVCQKEKAKTKANRPDPKPIEIPENDTPILMCDNAQPQDTRKMDDVRISQMRLKLQTSVAEKKQVTWQRELSLFIQEKRLITALCFIFTEWNKQPQP